MDPILYFFLFFGPNTLKEQKWIFYFQEEFLMASKLYFLS